MSDFFESANSVESTPAKINDIFEPIYGWTPSTDAFLGVNLRWPNFDLPNNYTRYFLSWHTEQVDIHWLRQQASLVYPRPVLVACDSKVDTSIFPDNVEFVRWITWHKQLNQLVKQFGFCDQPRMPKYKISSLCYRISQYKNFITAYLLEHANTEDIILTYHKKLGKPEDLHGYPAGLPWLDSLNLESLEPTWINFKDDFNWDLNKPVDNGDWRTIPFQHALVNFTNESFHYTYSELDGQPFIFPSPYLTEKTWKPLLAGRPFLAVSQWHTYKELEQLGLKFDFGFSQEFDNDSGDLTRIQDIFQTIDYILASSVKDLYEQSIDSVRYNVNHIVQGYFGESCMTINNQSKKIIMDFTNS